MTHRPVPASRPDRPAPGRRASFVRLLAATVVLFAFCCAMWFAWLGWDHEYYEVDGVAQGPYRSWQVIGCALSVVAFTVVLRLRATHGLGLLLLPLAGTVGFAFPWSADASASDSTGMWGVGLVMLLVGGVVGLLVVVAFVDAAHAARAGREPRATGGGPLPAP